MKLYIFFVTAVYLLCDVGSEEIPDFLHVCKKHDPEFEKCMIESVEYLRPILIKGDPNYHIPSIEPLIISDLMTEGITDLKLTTTNVKAYGCSDYQVKGIRMSWDDMTCDLDLDIPKLRLEADYEIDGKILMLPIRGKGLFEANITGITSHTIMKGDVYEKDGEEYLKYHTVILDVKLDHGEVRLDNINGDKVLVQIMNEVVNKNFAAFSGELMPAIKRALETIFLDIGNDIVQHFTVDQLFPY